MTRLAASARALTAGLVLIAAAPWSADIATAQNPTFTSKTSAVRVDVAVQRDRIHVRNLVAADFEVLDNGVPQQIELATFEETPLNVVVVLDMSNSVRGERLVQLRAASAALFKALRPTDMAAVMTFSDLVSRRAAFTANPATLQSAVEVQPDAGNTALVDASFAAMAHAESANGRPLIIIFSDGADTTSFLSPESVLDAAKRATAVVYGVTSQTDKSFLDDLVRATGGKIFNVDSLARLSRTFVDVLDQARPRYLLSYTPVGVAGSGWHTLTVRVKDRKATVRARPGYVAGS